MTLRCVQWQNQQRLYSNVPASTVRSSPVVRLPQRTLRWICRNIHLHTTTVNAVNPRPKTGEL